MLIATATATATAASSAPVMAVVVISSALYLFPCFQLESTHRAGVSPHQPLLDAGWMEKMLAGKLKGFVVQGILLFADRAVFMRIDSLLRYSHWGKSFNHVLSSWWWTSIASSLHQASDNVVQAAKNVIPGIPNHGVTIMEPKVGKHTLHKRWEVHRSHFRAAGCKDLHDWRHLLLLEW